LKKLIIVCALGLVALSLASCDLFNNMAFEASGKGVVVKDGSTISATTTWETGKIYWVQGTLTVNAALSIPGGTAVLVSPSGKIVVSSTGSITTTGTSGVVFTSAKLSYNGYQLVSGTATKGDWVGIIDSSSAGSTYSYVTVQYAQTGIDVNGSATINNSSFDYNEVALDTSGVTGTLNLDSPTIVYGDGTTDHNDTDQKF
jgi:hypothetical protein